MGGWTHIVTIKYLEIGKRMLNERERERKRERERERVLFQGDNRNLSVEGSGETKFLRPNVWDFNIISTMKNKNNSNLAVRRGKVNISILCWAAKLEEELSQCSCSWYLLLINLLEMFLVLLFNKEGKLLITLLQIWDSLLWHRNTSLFFLEKDYNFYERFVFYIENSGQSLFTTSLKLPDDCVPVFFFLLSSRRPKQKVFQAADL